MVGRDSAAVEARTVIVEPPSSRREGALVARAVFHILFWSAVLIGLERGAGSPAGDGSAPLAPAPAARAAVEVGEVAFADLDARDQRLFREIDSAVGELERARSATGAWPPIAELAGRGLAPFGAGSSDVRWRMLRDGLVTNYLGLPDVATGGASFVIVMVEPEPGIPADPQATPDEIHHRLADGTMLHVTIWRGPGTRDIERPLAAPAPEDGWRRITLKAR